MKLCSIAACLWLLSFACASAQAIKFEDVPKRSGLRLGYNRFEDRSMLITERDPVTGSAGKGSILEPRRNSRVVEVQAGAIWQGREPSKFLTEVFFAVFPDTQTWYGRAVNDIDKRAPFYFEPDTKIVAIADGERISMGPAEKPGGLDTFGNYRGAVFVVISLKMYRQIFFSEKLELAVGSIELKLTKRNIERLRTLLTEIEHRQPQQRNE